MKLPKIIVFDVGGTLIDSNYKNSVEVGYKYLYDKVFDVKEPYNEYLMFIKSLESIIAEREKGSLEFSFRSMFNYLCLIYGLKTCLSYEEIEDHFINQFYYYEKIEDVIELLEYLKQQGVRLAVFSNSMFSSHRIKRELAEVGILSYFESVISSADYLVRKPSTYVFKLYLKKYGILGYQSDEIAYIGNSYHFDIEPAIPLKMVLIHKGNVFKYHKHYLEISNYRQLIEEFRKDEK